MTRNECLAILKDKGNPIYKDFYHLFKQNYNRCRKYYDGLGYKGYVLHHKIVNCTNYEEWKIDEIEPLTHSEHAKIHMLYYKQGLGNPSKQLEMREKARLTRKQHNVQPWNKGKTKETDCRIKESPRKGKTGKDFPFLCASKKGKSGGWNKGLHGLPNLRHTEEQKAYMSELMKRKNPMSDAEARRRQKERISSPEIQQKRKEKMIGRKLYTNGIEKHFYREGSQPDGYVINATWKKKEEA